MSTHDQSIKMLLVNSYQLDDQPIKILLVNSYQQLSRFSTNKIRYILCSDEHSEGEHKHLNYIQVYVLHILEKNPSGCSICYIFI